MALAFASSGRPGKTRRELQGLVVSVAYSVVIPAFNEEARLPSFLPNVVKHFESEFPNNYEIIVVNDGSTDGTALWLDEQKKLLASLRVIAFSENRGKGAAVRAGVASATGDLILFCDADGATPISEERRLRLAVDAGADIAVGSRLMSSAETSVQRAFSRRLPGRLFASVAGVILRPPVRDTQCGFKLFPGDVGRRIASQAAENGYLFDLEWLCLAQRAEQKVAEVPVNWSEKPGSKLRMGRDGLRVFTSLWRLRRRVQQSKKAEGSR